MRGMDGLTIGLIIVLMGVGFFAGYLWQGRKGQQQHADAQSELGSARTRADTIEQAMKDLKDDNDQLNEENKQYVGKVAKLETELENANNNAKEKAEFWENSEKRMLAEFEKLSGDVLDKKSEKIKEVLEPVRTELKEFRKRADSIHTEETRELGALKNEIGNLQKNAVRVGEEANNLTRALKGDKKIQGNWGEDTLLRLLEDSGLRKNLDYEMQTAYNDDNGGRLIPDCVIRLPNNKHLVIDSKVSLIDFTKSVEAEHGSPEEKEHMAHHCKAVRKHVATLSDKGYQALGGVNSPDFVLMFMPVEPAYIVAIAEDDDLLQEAWNKKVIICAPSTLMPIMHTVRSIWQLERQRDNAKEIAKQGGKIYDKLVRFVKNMEDVGTALENAQTRHQDAYKQLKTGRGNLIDQTLGLKNMDIPTSPQKKMPVAFIDAQTSDMENDSDSEDVQHTS